MSRQYFKQENELGVTIWFQEGNRRISFGETPGNRHYEEYLEWVAKGNTPEEVTE